MFETVTVDQAIRRGKMMISYPVMIIILGTIISSVFLTTAKILPGIFTVIAIPAGLILAWMYWSFMITKWRLWAFENVRNVHELQKKAVEAQLIKDGGFFESTEIRSSVDKEKWASLQSKFDIKDVYSEDASVPTETAIYYSKGKISLQIAIMTLILGFGIYLFIIKIYIGACVACAMAVYVLYSEVKKIKDKNPQVVLNSKGIDTGFSGFVNWSDVSDDEVITRQTGKTSTTYLEYNYPGGSVQLDIAELDTNKTALENMLHTYRVRSEKKSVRETAI